MKWLAKRSSTDKYQRDMLIMAVFQRNVEKFLLPRRKLISNDQLGSRVLGARNRQHNNSPKIIQISKSWPNMNQRPRKTGLVQFGSAHFPRLFWFWRTRASRLPGGFARYRARHMRNIRQNLTFAFCYNARGIPLAAVRFIPLSVCCSHRCLPVGPWR